MTDIRDPRLPRVRQLHEAERLVELAREQGAERSAGERAQVWGNEQRIVPGAAGQAGEFAPLVYVQIPWPALWWIHVAAVNDDPTAAVPAVIDIEIQQGAGMVMTPQLYGPFSLFNLGTYWNLIQVSIFWPASQLVVRVRCSPNSPGGARVFGSSAAIFREPGGMPGAPR